jgi:hypothetical protein
MHSTKAISSARASMASAILCRSFLRAVAIHRRPGRKGRLGRLGRPVDIVPPGRYLRMELALGERLGSMSRISIDSMKDWSPSPLAQ